MKKILKRSIAAFLVMAMVCISFIEWLPPLESLAAPVTEVWRHFMSAAENDNGSNAAILVNTNEGTEGMEAGEMSFVLKPNDSQANIRFNVGPWITDNSNYMTVGYNASGWFYEYKGAGNAYPGISGIPTPPGAGEEMAITIKWNGTAYEFTAGGQTAEFSIPEEAFEGLKGGKPGFRIGSYRGTVSDIYFKDVEIKDGEGNVVVEKGSDTWELQTTDHGEVYEADVTVSKVTVSGKVVDANGNAVEGAQVTLDTATVTTGADGTWTFNDVVSGSYTVSAAKSGYQAAAKNVEVTDADVTDVVLELVRGAAIEFEGDNTISSDAMEVAIYESFPQAVGYTLKGGENDGKKFYGQTTKLTQLEVNKKLVTPEVTFEKNSDSKATYTMTIKEQDIDAVVTAVMEVKDNTLSFNITNIEAEAGTFFTIGIPNHNLVTAKANQSGAAFAGANMSTNTTVSGDTYSTVSALSEGKRGYMYAFVSTDGLSAGLWSNSENNVTADWQRVTATTATVDGVKETGLSSTYWTYQKSAEHRIENEDYEMPAMKVVITGDENDDNIIDWQDGAIAYRSIMNNPVGSELVPDRVAIRIAMNFNSHAQNPFLMTYDNAQKVYLNTDGLGQSILLKGYGSEGHDSGHLNYADVGKRIGGVEEMKKLLEQGKEIGATFGIHVNASETYPESIYFEEDRLMKLSDGGLDYGWNWLDQGVNINADYDLRNGREQRFVDLWEALGGEDNDLDFIYIDVWGNGQSGDNGTWASRQLAKEITQTCGWRLAGEWGYANEYDSTFQHWATDMSYGGANLQGINSFIARFIRNHQKDSWVGDYPSHGGAAVNPLLGGYDMKDFEGWQGRNDYLAYIQNLFDDNLATKFLQHYKVMKWVNGEPTTVNGTTWTPDMEITLQDDAKETTIVVSRQSNDGSSKGYRLRTMTFNDRVIMDGEKYLIPWFWDANGNTLASEDEKLYHWNQAGGTSTWTIPEGWDGAKIYELTETGNVECNDIATISGNQITITAEASVPYVIHKAGADEGIKATNLTWSKGAHLVDTGFNSNTLEYWDIKGEGAEIIWSAANNMMLSVGSETEEVSLTQTLTDLEPGKGYAAYVGVDNRSDAKAYIEVSVNGEVISNYTERSIAKNYLQSYAHNTNNATIAGGGSYFQNMYVFFTAPEEGEVTLTLKREAGEGKTYFDDVRVTNNMFGVTETDGNFNPFISEDKLVQTFEAVPQGIFPFVIGNVEGVNDNRTHLSEKHEPYTQAGWYNGVKKLDDVLDGNWSVKTNGLSQRGRVVYQTIPQNFRFEEGVTYNIYFDYEMGSENTYAFIVGNGESNGSNFDVYELEATDLENAQPQTFKFRLTGEEGNQSWIGIYSTTTPADTQGVGGDEANFGGYKDFVLDNLVIERSKAQKAELEELVDANSGRYEVNYTAESWEAFAEALAEANAALDDFEADQATVNAATVKLEEAVAGLEVIAVTLSGNITDEAGSVLGGIEVSVTMNDGKSVSTVTDSKGNYILPGVLFGTWDVVAESNVFATNTKEITVSEAQLEVTQDFTMVPEKTTLEGTITAVGEPVEGATVMIDDQTATTDENGYYKFENINTKAYTVKASKDGYDAASKEAVVVKGQTAVVNIMLPPLTRDEADYENDYADGVSTWDNLAGNTASTTISIVDGETKIIFPKGHTNVYETTAPQFKNGMVEMDVRSEKAGTRIGILFRALDMNNRVYVGVGDQADLYFTEYWGSKSGNSWSAMSQGPTFAAGETMHLKAEIVDTTIRLWVNDELVLENTMPSMPTNVGVIGLNTRAGHTVYVDNVKVTSYDLPTGDVQNVAGRVVDKDGAVIENAQVELLDNNGEVLDETTTDALGNYKFKNVVLGEYSVRASYGELTETVAVTVETGEDYVVVQKIVLGGAKEADKERLAAVIGAAKEVKASEDYQNATAETKAALEAALSAAEEVYADDNATQEAVDEAHEKLQEAINGLQPEVKINKDDLKELIDKTDKIDLSKYTADTALAVREALAEAKEVMGDANATQNEVDLAEANLKAAVDNLKESTIDVEAPTAPTNLKVTSVKKDSIELSWDASKDNVGVAGYKVYLDGLEIGVVDDTKATIIKLASGTEYEIEIRAYDEAGNESEGEVVTVTTKGEVSDEPTTDVPDVPNVPNVPEVIAPETGDVSPVMLLLSAMLLAACVILLQKRKMAK